MSDILPLDALVCLLNSNDNDDAAAADGVVDLYVIDSDFMMSSQTEIQQIFVNMEM